jgi:hypothetical protein
MKPFPGLSKGFEMKNLSLTTIFIGAAFIVGFLLVLYFWKNPLRTELPPNVVTEEERSQMIRSLEESHAANMASTSPGMVTESEKSEMIKALEASTRPIPSADGSAPVNTAGTVTPEERAKMLKALEQSASNQ